MRKTSKWHLTFIISVLAVSLLCLQCGRGEERNKTGGYDPRGITSGDNPCPGREIYLDFFWPTALTEFTGGQTIGEVEGDPYLCLNFTGISGTNIAGYLNLLARHTSGIYSTGQISSVAGFFNESSAPMLDIFYADAAGIVRIKSVSLTSSEFNGFADMSITYTIQPIDIGTGQPFAITIDLLKQAYQTSTITHEILADFFDSSGIDYIRILGTFELHPTDVY